MGEGATKESGELAPRNPVRVPPRNPVRVPPRSRLEQQLAGTSKPMRFWKRGPRQTVGRSAIEKHAEWKVEL